MIQQFLYRQRRLARGVLNTYLKRAGKPYREHQWWDDRFYTAGISDRQTIAAQKNEISARYHYASVEMRILRYLYNEGIQIEGQSVLDIGSGSGHWIDFYRGLGAGRVVGVDVSARSVAYLRERYRNTEGVEIHHGTAAELLAGTDGGEDALRFDVISAIGVLFHIVDDEDWRRTLAVIAERLKPGGLLVVGGHFGLLDRVNVQIDREGNINKRLRSRFHWKRTLRPLGFQQIILDSNLSYLWIRDTQPENSVLFARR